MYQAEQLVFVDESLVDRQTTYRGRAWSIRGTKVQRKAFFVRGRRLVAVFFFQIVVDHQQLLGSSRTLS